VHICRILAKDGGGELPDHTVGLIQRTWRRSGDDGGFNSV